jgi:ubiquinone/menaquinone biosynthesis C-methylase UbiE
MGKLVNITTALHESSNREYLPRMVDDKANCMIIAKQYEKDYWDGDRRYGYGGYSYMPGRWKPVAEKLIQNYSLTNESSVLDVGCGKGYLLFELKLLLPGLRVAGLDISEHGLADAPKEIKDSLIKHRAQDNYSFENNEFDLVISLGCFHNLRLFDLEKALAETERVGKQGYVMLESYRNELELFNLQCWALTCESFFDHEEWPWIYEHFGYTGDYEFIYFK